MARPLVVLDLAARQALLGGTVAVVRVRPGGALEYGGRVIRPLRFGERWRLLDGAAATEGSDGSVGASVLAAAESGPTGAGPTGAGTDVEQIARVLALHLAGARPDRTVPGCAAQLAALVAAGWNPRDVLDADADLIDLLTVEEGNRSDGGWTSIVLAVDDDAARVPLDEILRVLECDLLGRLAPPESPESADGAGSVGPSRQATAAAPPIARPSALAPARGHPRDASPPSPPRAPEAGHPTAPFPAVEPATPSPSTEALHGAAIVGREGAPSSPPRFPRPIRADWPGSRPSNGAGAAPSVTAQPSEHGDRSIPAPAGPWIAQPADPPGEPLARRATRTEASVAPVVVHDDLAASRTDRLAFPAPSRPDTFDVADEVAALLDEESDLRGLRR